MTSLFLFILLFQQEIPETADPDPVVPEVINVEDAQGLQAVVATSAGEFVMEFYADQAPNHVAQFMKLAREDYYVGTVFHSMVPHGIVQAGDPLTKEPDRASEYGTGGFNVGLEAEISDIEFVEGTVVATLLPGDTASAGSQFFVCVGDQPQFTGQFTAFGRIVQGLEIVDGISMTPTDEKQIALDRVEILGITIRPIPPPPVPPFSEESVDELAEYRVVMETSKGDIILELFPDVAPNHVRHFLRLTSLGVYDKTAFHRVAPGFVIQAGDLNTRTENYPQAAQEFVVPINAEINDMKHTAGIVSMARGEEPDSALTSFFIVLADQPPLDDFYTVFGRVVEGMDVVGQVEGVEVDGETPLERVDIYTMRVERQN